MYMNIVRKWWMQLTKLFLMLNVIYNMNSMVDKYPAVVLQ